MKLRFNVLFVLSFLLSGSAQAAGIDRSHPDYQAAYVQAFNDALSGDIVTASAIASYAAALVAYCLKIDGNFYWFGRPNLDTDALNRVKAELEKEDSGSDDFPNLKSILTIISIAAKAGHVGALALVSYCTAVAHSGNPFVVALVAAFANKGVVVDADINALSDADAAYNNAVIDIAYAFIGAATSGNVTAASEISGFTSTVAQPQPDDTYGNQKIAEAIAAIAQAAQAGNEKAQAVIAYFTALANAGDANAAAVVAAFATAHENLHVAAIAVE